MQGEEAAVTVLLLLLAGAVTMPTSVDEQDERPLRCRG